MSKVLLPLFAVLMLFSACSERKARKSDYQAADTLAIVAPSGASILDSQLFASRTRFTTLSISGKVAYKQGSSSEDLSFSLRMKEDSIIWISITATLGIEVARIKALKDSVYVLDHLGRRLLIKDYSYLKQFTSMNLGFEQLQALLVGNRIFSLSNRNEPRLLPDTNLIFYSNFDSASAYSMQINPEYRVTASSVTENYSGRKVNLQNQDIARIDNHLLPAGINIEVPDKQLELFIQYANPKFGSELKFPFSIPSKYEVVR